MAQPMAHRDQRPTDPLADIRRAWLRQTAAYARSVRLYQEQLSRQRAVRAGPLGRAVPSGLTLRPRSLRLRIIDVPNVVAARSALDLLAPPPAPPCPLTPRQLEISALIAEGLTNGQIARQLMLSRGTVGNYVGQMLRRLGVHNRAQIAASMIRHIADPG